MLYDDPELTEPAWQRYAMRFATAILLVGGIAATALVLEHSRSIKPHVEKLIVVNIVNNRPLSPPEKPEKEEPARFNEPTITRLTRTVPSRGVVPALTDLTGSGGKDYGLGVGETSTPGAACVDPTKCGKDGGETPELDTTLYESAVQEMVHTAIIQDVQLHSAIFRTVAELTFDSTGNVTSVTLRDFEGDATLRAPVTQALQHIAARGELPPALESGKPWVVRINAHPPR